MTLPRLPFSLIPVFTFFKILHAVFAHLSRSTAQPSQPPPKPRTNLYSDMEQMSDPGENVPLTADTGLVESSSEDKDSEIPGFDFIWTSPPKLLPGPENHPFFSTDWEALHSAETQQPLKEIETATPPPAPTTQKLHSTQGLPLGEFSFGPPPVFPFVPAPAIEMLPTTPDNEQVGNPEDALPLESPVISTPGLTDSQTNIDDYSPQSRPSSFDHGTNKSVLDQSDAKRYTSELSHASKISEPLDTGSPSPRESKSDPTLSIHPVCHLTYLRAIPNEATTEPAVLLNGQLWRSSNQKGKGWRRNQWIVDVR
jgi:hypothetical protein